MELSIPELRERIKTVAAHNFGEEVKSLPLDEVIGEIIDIELDKRAISIFDVTQDHVFATKWNCTGTSFICPSKFLSGSCY